MQTRRILGSRNARVRMAARARVVVGGRTVMRARV
jgi:hypothetical protein